jgi:hypothetical protein
MWKESQAYRQLHQNAAITFIFPYTLGFALVTVQVQSLEKPS